MGDFVIKINERNVSGELLLNDLQEVADELNQDTVSAVQYNELGRYSSTTLIRRFGSWFAALERAGLKMSRTRMNLTEDELFNNIKDVWMSLGRQPKYSEVRAPLSLYSVSTYDKRFGGWNNALKQFAVWIEDDELSNDIVKSTDAVRTNIDNEYPRRKTKRKISDRLRFRVLMRDGFTCQSCGASPIKSRDVELHVDHVVPWSKGGETSLYNLVTKCSRCNLGKGNLDETADERL